MSLQTILEEIEYDSNMVHDLWYLVSAVVMSSVNRPEDIKLVYRLISDRVDLLQDKSRAEKNQLLASIVLKLREAVLKSHVIIGFPKTINTLQQLANVTPDPIKSLLPTKPLRKEESWSDVQNQRQRGRSLFGKIYDRHTDKVIRNMHSTHPDLAQTALHQLYGPTLSEVSILNAKETSLVTVAGLMIQNIPLQLIGHSHGAMHNGATKQEISRVQSIVSILADYYKTPIAKL